jgi:hypothetical protein
MIYGRRGWSGDTPMLRLLALFLNTAYVAYSHVYYVDFSLEYEKYIYNRILLYYEISDKIREEILKLDDVDKKTKFDVLMPFTDSLRNTADILLEKYTKYIKNIDNNSLRDEILFILNDLLEYVAVYKNKLYSIYKDK